MVPISPYDKLDEAEQERLVARRKTRRRITIIVMSSIVLVAVVVATVVGVSETKNKKSGLSSSIKAMCDLTLYPNSCYNSMTPLMKSNNFKPQDFFELSVQVARDELAEASTNFAENVIKKFNITDNSTLSAIETCEELFSLSLDHLNNSISTKNTNLLEAFDDLRTWLSSAGTCQQTCMDGLENASNEVKIFVNDNFKNSNEYTSNSLAIISSFESIAALGSIGRRRLMNLDDAPEWLSFGDRKLLQTKIYSTAPSSSITPDAVVAKDGSGHYTTIMAALKAVPDHSKNRFVIYVKKGVYYENVKVETSKWNVMMFGDGEKATIVSGSLNIIDGTPTFQSATFGKFF